MKQPILTAFAAGALCLLAIAGAEAQTTLRAVPSLPANLNSTRIELGCTIESRSLIVVRNTTAGRLPPQTQIWIEARLLRDLPNSPPQSYLYQLGANEWLEPNGTVGGNTSSTLASCRAWYFQPFTAGPTLPL